ncbi:MAG: hypothetical protein ACFE0J_16975 [Elainellaceae cyanobacterium]
MNKPAVITVAIMGGTLIGVLAGVYHARNQPFVPLSQVTQERTALAEPVDASISSSQSTSQSVQPSDDRGQTQSSGADPQSSQSAAPSSSPRAPQLQPQEQPEPTEGIRLQVEVSEADINQLVKDAIASHSDRSSLLAGADDFSLTIRNGTVEGGTRVSLADIPTDQLGERERTALESATSLIPGLGNRDIYVGVVGRPRVENGEIKLGDDLTLKLGRLNLPFSQISSRLGVPVDSIEQEINRQLQSRGIQIQTIEFVGDRVILQGDVDVSQSN